jgi:hypothetical protein
MLLHEVIDKNWNVFTPFTQGWNVDREDVDSIVKVVAKSAVGDHGPQVAISGGDYSYVDTDFMSSTNPPDLSFLQSTQKLGLHGHVKLSNLVEEKRAPIRDLEEPFLLGVRSGE